MSVVVRFAPSPTGLLHVGNARVALINWLYAKRHGGYFVLRLDDTDNQRATPEFDEAIRQDLTWLGLGWDRRVNQSRRFERYHAAIERLTADNRLYPCYETPAELAALRKRRLAEGRPPVYDRAALRLSDARLRAFHDEGRRPHWRFRLRHEDVAWEDLIRGECHYGADHLSDPVLVRADGRPLYTLPSVVDDIQLRVSHVIRGEDHATNTAAQIQLFRALGAEPPSFGHLPLLTDKAGAGLSKRLGSLPLRALRSQGIEAMAVNSLLATFGSSDPVRPSQSLDDLVDRFDLGRYGRAAPKFDPDELVPLNARLLREMPYEAARPRLEDLGLVGLDESFWLALRPNLTRFDEIVEWWAVCRAELAPVLADPGLTDRAARLLPPEPWSADTWPMFAAALRQATGSSGRALFLPLRLALTGRDHGPDLKTLLPLVGRARAEARLRGETA